MNRVSHCCDTLALLDGLAIAISLSRMNILHSTLLGAILLFLAGSARAGEAKEEGFSDLTVEQVSDLIAKKEADVFDNNSKEVYAKGHVPTAKWVSFKDVKESDLPQDKSRKVVFYCANTH
jgi:Rhodanese-like domain